MKKKMPTKFHNIEKIKDFVHTMCRHAFESNMGDAEDSHYDELDEMLWNLIDDGRN